MSQTADLSWITTFYSLHLISCVGRFIIRSHWTLNRSNVSIWMLLSIALLVCVRDSAHTFLSVWVVRRCNREERKGKTSCRNPAVDLLNRRRDDQQQQKQQQEEDPVSIWPASLPVSVKHHNRHQNIFPTQLVRNFSSQTWSFQAAAKPTVGFFFFFHRCFFWSEQKSTKASTNRVWGGQHGDPGQYRTLSTLGPEPQRAVRGRGHRFHALHQCKSSIRDWSMMSWVLRWRPADWLLRGGFSLISQFGWEQRVCVSVCVHTRMCVRASV